MVPEEISLSTVRPWRPGLLLLLEHSSSDLRVIDANDRAVSAIEELPLTKGDTKGDLYEYMLGKLSTAGIAGQFRTPRHAIRAMVEIVDPQPTDVICDPACGTAGFPVGVMEYLREKQPRS